MTDEKIFIVREEVRKLETNPLRAIVIPEKRIELDKALEEKITKKVQSDWKELLKTHHVCRQEDSVPTIIRMTIQKLKESV